MSGLRYAGDTIYLDLLAVIGHGTSQDKKFHAFLSLKEKMTDPVIEIVRPPDLKEKDTMEKKAISEKAPKQESLKMYL